MNSFAADSWRPRCDADAARRRAEMLACAHRFFAERDVLEVDTPVLGETSVTDPQIESFALRSVDGHGRDLYLQTSPEYYMKRLLCAGFPDIYQVCKVFRDGESGARHQPEFTIAEWYRLGFGLREMIQDTVDFITTVVGRRRITGDAQFLSYGRAFRDAVGLDPMTADLDELRLHCGADDRLRSAIGEDRDAWLDLIVAQRISTEFPTDRLTVIYHYPASQCALARLCPDDASVADRFEVFCGELELANGFVELTDAGEQAERFDRDIDARQRCGQPQYDPDSRLLAALRSGMPPCAGVAAGFDRLQMLRDGADDMRDVQTFPFDVRTEEDV